MAAIDNLTGGYFFVWEDKPKTIQASGRGIDCDITDVKLVIDNARGETAKAVLRLDGDNLYFTYSQIYHVLSTLSLFTYLK